MGAHEKGTWARPVGAPREGFKQSSQLAKRPSALTAETDGDGQGALRTGCWSGTLNSKESACRCGLSGWPVVGLSAMSHVPVHPACTQARLIPIQSCRLGRGRRPPQEAQLGTMANPGRVPVSPVPPPPTGVVEHLLCAGH